jgi:ribosomal protein S18 acetylase RimI-like enzyme
MAPQHQRQKLDTRLLREVEHRLLQKGCARINLFIFPMNAAVQPFYQRSG